MILCHKNINNYIIEQKNLSLPVIQYVLYGAILILCGHDSDDTICFFNIINLCCHFIINSNPFLLKPSDYRSRSTSRRKVFHPRISNFDIAFFFLTFNFGWSIHNLSSLISIFIFINK